jgi:hypothetical protein
MDHIQGTLLDTLGQPVLESIDVSLEIHRLDQAEFWTGCFEPLSVRGIISGETFRLVLDDGRARDVLIEYVEALTPHASRVLFKSAGG